MNTNLEKAESIMKQALQAYGNGNIQKGDVLRENANEFFELYKNELNESKNNMSNPIYGKTNNFGIIHKIFESNAPELYKTKKGKQIIANYIKIINEDATLRKQFTFYNEMLSVNDVNNPSMFVNEAVELSPKFHIKDIVKSNEKLVKFIKDNKLNESIELDENLISLFESIEFVLTNTKCIKNLSSFINAKANITDYINEHIEQSKNSLNENKYSGSLDDFANKALNDFNEKYKDTLNEAEQEFVKELIDAKFNDKMDKRKGIFDKCKNEAISAINTVVVETSGDIKEKLLSLKERLLNKNFDDAKLVSDVAEMIEIKNTLLDE